MSNIISRYTKMLKTAGEWHHKVMFLNMPQKYCQNKKRGKLAALLLAAVIPQITNAANAAFYVMVQQRPFPLNWASDSQ